MAAGKHRKFHDVEQTKKMTPITTCKITFSQHVTELVFGVNTFDLDLGVQIDSVEQPIQHTLCVLDTCLIVGLLPFMIILTIAPLSSKKCRASHKLEKTSRLRKHNRLCTIEDRCTELES